MKTTLRLLFTVLLALVGVSSWAQFDAEKTYTLCASGSSAYLTTNEMTSTSSAKKTFTFGAEPEQFRIVESGTGYTIQSVSSGKFIGVNQWDAIDAEYAWNIVAVDGTVENTYKINLQGESNKGLGWDNAVAGQGVYTDKSGMTWVIEVVAGDEPLYTALGATCEDEYAESYSYTNGFENIRDINVESYEGYVILRGWAGTEGYDVKLAYDGTGYISGVTPIYNGVEQETVTEGVAKVKANEEKEIGIMLFYSYCVDMGDAEEGGYATLYNEDYTYYCIEWPQEEVAAEPYTLVGKEQARPNEMVCEMLFLEEDDVIIPMSEGNNVKVDVYSDYILIHDFMGAYGVDLQCWYMTDDSDEENPQTMIYKYQIVGQEFGEDEIPGNVSGSYIEVNKEGYDLSMGMCVLSEEGGWLTIIANKLSDMENYYHYSLELSKPAEVAKPAVNPVEGEYDELQTITITFDQAVTVVEDDTTSEDWMEWTYAPVATLENQTYMRSESAKLVAGENEGEVVFTIEDAMVLPGDYVFTIPAGAVTFADGTQNPESTYRYTVTGKNYTGTLEEGETGMTITPVSGETVSVLDKFEVKFTGYININIWSSVAALYDAEDNEVCQASMEDNFDGTYTIELFKKVTKAGTYTLKFNVENSNEDYIAIGTHDYEATYTVDGTEYVEMPCTITATTAKMLDEENYDELESEVAFGQDVTIVLDEDNFVIKNFLGVEGFDLTANYMVWGGEAYVMSLSAPGVEEPGMMIEVTPSTEIGTIGLMVSQVQLDPKDGLICVQVYRGEDAETYCLLAWGAGLEQTGISSANGNVENGAIFNLNGQKLNSLQKGINIVGGKKVVVK